MGFHNHKKLDVWKNSMKLVEQLYELTDAFPKSEQFGLRSQIRRCAVSVPANIAEGSGRNTDAQMVNFLNISRGSICELETLIILSDNLGYLEDETSAEIQAEIKILEKQLYNLMDFISSRK